MEDNEYGPSPLQPLAGDYLFFQELTEFWIKTLALSLGIDRNNLEPKKYPLLPLASNDLEAIPLDKNGEV